MEFPAVSAGPRHGGHCIGVDPYYLTCSTARRRRAITLRLFSPDGVINDGMMVSAWRKNASGDLLRRRREREASSPSSALPSRKMFRIPATPASSISSANLESFGLQVQVHDPLADPEDAKHEYGLDHHRTRWVCSPADAVILAVAHGQLY